MAGEISAGHAKSAGIVGILIVLVSAIDFIVGIVWVTYGGGDAQGVWIGLLVSFSDVISPKLQITFIFSNVFNV